MNILYLAHRIPYPPDKGDKLRSFHQLERLSKRHRVWCACFVDDPADQRYVGTLSAYCADVVAVRLNRARATLRGLRGLACGRTVTESFYRDPRMSRALGRWSLEVGFDAVVAFSSGMAPYALQVPAPTRVLDLCDLDSRKWLDYASASSRITRRVYATEGRRLAARELEWLQAFDATILITDAEASPLRRAARQLDRGTTRASTGGKLYIVGNGVTLPELDGRRMPRCGFSTRTEETSAPVVEPDNEQIVGFVGVMDYRPNVDAVCRFVDKCWPRIRAACPTALFRIVGRSPTRRVRRLGATPGVRVVGEVADPSLEISRCAVSVAPMRIARGLQNKVLEAMAAARPVVLSEEAARGIDARRGHEFIVAGTPDEMADAVVKLLEDPSERGRIGSAARRFVAANHRWDVELQRFELIVAGRIGPVSARMATRPLPSEQIATESETLAPA